MRPLAIWAMQWALSRVKLTRHESISERKEEEDIVSRHHAGFSKVAHILKLKEETASKSIFQVIYDFTCKRVWA